MRAWARAAASSRAGARQGSDMMKRKFLAAAGLLCLGTSSAFAFSMEPMAPDMAKAVKDVWAQQMMAEKPSIFDTGEAWMSDAPQAKPAFAAKADDLTAAPAS